jgi:hypothetical protein
VSESILAKENIPRILSSEPADSLASKTENGTLVGQLVGVGGRFGSVRPLTGSVRWAGKLSGLNVKRDKGSIGARGQLSEVHKKAKLTDCAVYAKPSSGLVWRPFAKFRNDLHFPRVYFSEQIQPHLPRIPWDRSAAGHRPTQIVLHVGVKLVSFLSLCRSRASVSHSFFQDSVERFLSLLFPFDLLSLWFECHRNDRQWGRAAQGTKHLIGLKSNRPNVFP